MTFVNEIPTAEDIEKYELPYKLDLEKPIEHRRMWTVDRERDFFLTGGGLTGNPAFEDPKTLKVYFSLYLSGSKFRIIMEPKRTPGDFKADPFFIHWPALLEIWAIRPQENRMVDVTKMVTEQPDASHPMLNNYSFNKFVAIFKEAVTVFKAAEYNKHIKSPITVTFGF
ncbi:hypothetical protein [Limnobacter sp.]|uniref:hypothetical protein n=1 Tax=Limnobacter sp. TaxID=2003368 RepID=UPI002FE05A57